jgi:hypothetical protein
MTLFVRSGFDNITGAKHVSALILVGVCFVHVWRDMRHPSLRALVQNETESESRESGRIVGCRL